MHTTVDNRPSDATKPHAVCGPAAQRGAAPLGCPCAGAYLAPCYVYTAPPEGEVRFQFTAAELYRRELWRCRACRHFVSRHAMDADDLYGGDYVTSNYGEEGLEAAFEKIVALDPFESDNAGRVDAVLAFADRRFAQAPASRAPAVLDVGSGLGIFVHAMKAAGWACTALDPDRRSVEHARDHVGVEAVCGDFATTLELGCFDLITFNKVLEHVPEPLLLLRRALVHLSPRGFVYVELPDGETAIADGPHREEFFIDHWHVFSAASLGMLAARAGFSVERLERLREPSGKYTLRAFLVPPPPPSLG